MLSLIDQAVIGAVLLADIEQSQHLLSGVFSRECETGTNTIDQHLAAFYERRYAHVVTARDHMLEVE